MSFLSSFVEVFLKIIILLDSETRTNIFIGVTGLIVAVIIFIAEFMNGKECNLSKRVILYKTDIKRKFAYLLFVLLFMWFCDIFCFDCDRSFFSYGDVVHLFLEVILNVFVLISFWYTGKMFFTAIKLCVENDYFSKALDEYIRERSKIIHAGIISSIKKEHKFEERKVQEFIDCYPIFEFGEPDSSLYSEFEPVFSNNYGVIVGFNYNKIIDLIKIYEEEKWKIMKNGNIDKLPIVYIVHSIGSKTNKSVPVFLVKKRYKKLFDNLGSFVIVDDDKKYYNDEIKTLIDDLFGMAEDFKEPERFDDNKRLFNYFDFLYDNKLEYIKDYALANIEILYRKVGKNYGRNQQASSFVNSLALLAYKKGSYNDYVYISKFELNLYYQQILSKNVDFKEVAYRFANNYFKIHYIYLKDENNSNYYDFLMSNLFRFILHLMKNQYYDAVFVVLDNMFFGSAKYTEEDFSKCDISNFQFICGLVYCLVVMFDKNLISKNRNQEQMIEDKKNIKKIVSYIKNSFFDFFDAWDTILKFKKYFNYKSCVQEAYDWFDFDFVDHKYKSSWSSSWSFDERQVLKELLVIFNLSFTDQEYVDCSAISKDDKIYFQQLLNLFNTENTSSIEVYFDIKFNSKNIIISLEKAISEADKMERKYNRTHRLKIELKRKFNKLVNKYMREPSIIESYLLSLNKVIHSNDILKQAYGLTQLIPRDLFFGEVFGLENVAESFGDTFPRGIEKEYVNQIEMFSKIIDETLSEILNSLGNLDDYVIITNYLNALYLSKDGYDYYENKLKYNDYEIDVIRIPNVTNLYLLKKEYLPIINYCKFDETWDHENIDGSIYYNFTDLSRASKVREDIIASSSWLEEKGTLDEQHDYLKENCYVMMYMAYTIKSDEKAVAYKFILNDE